MTQTPPPATSLPPHERFAYELCLSLVKLVAKTRIADRSRSSSPNPSRARSRPLPWIESGPACLGRGVSLTKREWPIKVISF
jgi:hypothetical protein